MQLLFVDDEKRVLNGLQRMLFGVNRDWKMRFCTSGDEALNAMEETPADIVVSDMRMPGMDGAALLGAIKHRYPRTVRIILSGYADRGASLRAVPVAHRFLSKPCEPEVLRDVIEGAVAHRALLANDTLRAAIGEIGTLPSVPEVLIQVRELLAQPAWDVNAVVAVVEGDVGMSGKVLQLVNSAFFGLPQRTSDLKSAVLNIGAQMLHNLVLTVGVFESFSLDRGTAKYLTFDRFLEHSHRVARLAGRMAGSAPWAAEAVTAGLLHDCGKLILMDRLPDVTMGIWEQAALTGLDGYVVEREVLGVTHAEIGAYLLGIWGLPPRLTEAVACHHSGSAVAGRTMDEVQTIYIANRLVCGSASSDTAEDPVLSSPTVRDRVAEWRTWAAGAAAGEAG